MRDNNRGMILSFEGIDASGKNTQSRLLFDYLGTGEKIGCEYISFPDYETSIGSEIRDFLEGKKEYALEARHLLYAANRYEKKDVIEDWLERGKIIIANRYCESNLAYGVANGLSLVWLEKVESQMPQSDYVFYLRASPQLSQSRKERSGKDRYESDLAFLERVQRAYDALSEPGRWITVDADQSREAIHLEISKLALSIVRDGELAPARGKTRAPGS
jgi:dTMP kinase